MTTTDSERLQLVEHTTFFNAVHMILRASLPPNWMTRQDLYEKLMPLEEKNHDQIKVGIDVSLEMMSTYPLSMIEVHRDPCDPDSRVSDRIHTMLILVDAYKTPTTTTLRRSLVKVIGKNKKRSITSPSTSSNKEMKLDEMRSPSHRISRLQEQERYQSPPRPTQSIVSRPIPIRPSLSSHTEPTMILEEDPTYSSLTDRTISTVYSNIFPPSDAEILESPLPRTLPSLLLPTWMSKLNKSGILTEEDVRFITRSPPVSVMRE